MSLSPRPSIRKVQIDSELRSRKSSLKSSLKITTVSFKNTIALHKAGTFIDKSALDKVIVINFYHGVHCRFLREKQLGIAD